MIARTATRQSERFAILDVLAEGVLVTDLDGRLVHANAAACAILGLDAEAAAADPGWWLPFNARRTTGAPLEVGAQVVATGRAVRDIIVEVDRADGETITLSTNYLPLRGDDDTVNGLVLSFGDVTERDREHRRSLASEERLREAHEVARLANWEWEPGGGDDVVFDTLAGDGAQAWVRDRLATMPAAECRRLRDDFASILRGERAQTVMRYHDPSVPLWVETRARGIRDADGRVVCIRGTSQDVTDDELAKQQVRDARDFLGATLDSLAAHVAVLDEDGVILLTNRAWDEFGAANGGRGVGRGTNYLTACDDAGSDPVARRVADGLRSVIAGTADRFTVEYPCHAPTADRWFVLRVSRFGGAGPARAIVTHDDITTRHEAQAQVRTQAGLLDQVDVSVVATDRDGRVTHWNAGAEALYGWTSEEATGHHVAGWIDPVDGKRIDRELRAHGRWEGDVQARRKDGATFPAHVHAQIVATADGSRIGMSAVSTDVTARVAAERALIAARNHLRAITDSMGDGLFTLDTNGEVTYMNAVAESLLGWTSEDLLGRVMHDVSHRAPNGSRIPIEDCPMLHARRDGKTVRVEDDTFLRKDGQLIPVAYTASPFETAEGVEGCVVVFEEISDRKAHEAALQREADKLGWIGTIQDALAEGRFVLYAQPIVDLQSGLAVQHELLLRMRGQDGAIISPAAYLPIAEEYGLITEIDRWVIERGVAVAARGEPVEINLSARSIGDQTLLDHIERCLHAAAVDPTLLVFEITETAIFEDQAAAAAFAERLRHLGCKLALDDFGTGYGGFTYLKNIPVDYLKIDIEFVRDLVSNPASGHVVRAVVALARGFDLKTVAEGVEDAETLALLREIGVDYVQGYHLARPGPVDDVLSSSRRYAKEIV